MNLSNIKQPFTELFSGDFSGNPMQRATPGVLFCTVKPVGFQNPECLVFNKQLSHQIGLGDYRDTDLDFLVGNNLPENIVSYATAYAGHQFGNWAGQLGDGRAVFAGEIINKNSLKTEIQWKGAGATPYSRFADGRAVLRSSVREYLASEAMHFLGVPTTRALSLCLTGEKVVRDMMYDGHPREEDGAVVMRTAESFLRFGHIEWLTAQKDVDALKKLCDFTIESYFPEIENSENQYRKFFESVCEKTSHLMVEWYRVGFVHGVMNTDNMSVLGLTIDYGPFSFLEEYRLDFTPNTTDIPGRRYAFGKQGRMSQWNLWQLANALFPIIQDEAFLEQTLNDFSINFWKKYDEMMCRKFGFDHLPDEDGHFFSEGQSLMEKLELDYTLFFSKLETLEKNTDISEIFKPIGYKILSESDWESLKAFLETYFKHLENNRQSLADSCEMMRKNNPKFILRNYLLFECIEELQQGKKDLLNQLLKAIECPYEELFPEFSVIRPEKYNGVPGCSTLSCSS